MKYIVIVLSFIIHFVVIGDELDKFVSYGDLINSLELVAKYELESSESIQKEFKELQKSHGLSDSKEVYREYVRVKLAFEATRDSGLWQIVWAVTDKEPNSDSIWKQWSGITQANALGENKEASAIAECDELSALFALISRGMGVKNIGLFWPTWNHTVAVWTTENSKGEPIRIVVPTSQVFISSNATLGTTEFDPYKQKTIYNYDRKDVTKDHKIPKTLADKMVQQVRKYAAKDSTYLQKRRNELSRKLGGS